MFRNISSLVIISVCMINFMYGNCGSCQGDNNPGLSQKSIQKKTTVNTLIMSAPKDGIIEGLVITSCGKCNLGTKDRGCSLSVKFGDKIYPVKGTGIHDHGDAHGNEGFCSAIRVAWTKGNLKKNVFYADSFVLVGN